MMLKVRTAVANGTFERGYAVAELSGGHDARFAEPPDPRLSDGLHPESTACHHPVVALVRSRRSSCNYPPASCPLRVKSP